MIGLFKRVSLLLICGAFMLGIWSAVKPESAYACSCAAPPAVSQELERKTAIFSGKVIEVKPPEQKEIMSSADPIRVTFAVDRVWKGAVAEKTVVGTASSSASCGIENFAMDAEYIVYAYGEPDMLETGICERTKLLSSASEDLAALGNGKEPTKLASETGKADKTAAEGGDPGRSGRSGAEFRTRIERKAERVLSDSLRRISRYTLVRRHDAEV